MLMQLVGQNQRFERVEVSREEALSMFQENKFKVRRLVFMRLIHAVHPRQPPSCCQACTNVHAKGFKPHLMRPPNSCPQASPSL